MTTESRKKRQPRPHNTDHVLPPEMANALVPLGAVIDDTKETGRPTLWSQELQDEICAHMIAGKTLLKISALPGMPSVRTVVRWQRDNEIFRLAYARAREEQADTYADMMIDIAFDSSTDWMQDPDTGQWRPNHDTVNRAKLKVDTLKWVASKLKPKTYGDRVEARVMGADGGAIQIDQRSVNINIDASVMTAEARDLLRSAVLGAIAPPAAPTDEEDS